MESFGIIDLEINMYLLQRNVIAFNFISYSIVQKIALSSTTKKKVNTHLFSR